MSLTEKLSQKVWSKPTEGIHKIVIKDMTIVTGDNYEYLRLSTMLDSVREFNINLFERDLDFLQHALLEKFGEGHTFTAMLTTAIDTKTEFNIWIRYNSVTKTDETGAVSTKEYTNIYWSEPKTQTATERISDEEFLEAVANAVNKGSV